MQITKIQWRDSRMYITQCSREEDFDNAKIESIGYLVKETETNYVLAGDLIEDELRRVIVIPKENVIQVITL